MLLWQLKTLKLREYQVSSVNHLCFLNHLVV